MKGNKLIDDHVQISVNLVRYKSHGKQFEIAVDPDKAVAFLEGQNVDLDEVVESDQIFVDMKKGLVASEEELKSVFQTINTNEIITTMLKKGEVQFSAKYRSDLREKKLKRVIHLVHINAINPQTKLPHPENRIASAMEEAKVRLDDFKRAEDQVKDVVEKLRPIIPISLEKLVVELSAPAMVAARVYGKAKPHAKNEQWLNDGSLKMTLELPAGLLDELTSELNSLSQGQVELEVKKE